MKNLKVTQMFGLCFLLIFGLGVFSSLASKTKTSSAKQTPLQKVIEGAKKEGKLVFFGAGQNYDAAVLAKGIKKKFGVDLQISILPGSQTQGIAKIAMEIQSGLDPSYDIIVASHTNVMSVLRPKGLLADIDWRSLMREIKDINPQYYAPAPADYFVESGYIQTLVYNSAKISTKDLPKSFKEMVDPKWQGKFGWMKYPIANAEICYYLGLTGDNGVQFVRDIIKNKPSRDSFDALNAKLSMGELLFAVIGSQEYNKIPLKDPKTPIKWAPIKDFCLVVEIPKLVIKNAKNINAATLFVLYCGTPEGRAYQKSQGSYTYLDRTTNDYKMIREARRRGINVVYTSRDAKYSNWLTTTQSKNFVDKIDMALKGQ